MANLNSNNAKTKPRKLAKHAADYMVSDKSKKREAVAVQVAKALPDNWRDTDIQNTDYWACKPK